ncbi:DUF4442 domain-containing protein [Serinicoccus chungangensis]|uniref:DUF4442 domain-containing protein n=1 Tax=Serinicoccus chungangensis TaxID=767452 RepID=UPI000AE13EDC|nr:DUF4442 domain-containing protein [Serinicoccus chungangensis]
MSSTPPVSRSPQRVGRLKALATSPRALRLGMNLWPPFLGSGIRVVRMDADLRHVRVRLRHTPLTTNYVGTLFGGSLFAMTDPFWMLMVLRDWARGMSCGTRPRRSPSWPPAAVPRA